MAITSLAHLEEVKIVVIMMFDSPGFSGKFLLKASDGCSFDNYIFTVFAKIIAMLFLKSDYTMAEVRSAK